jgi:hypothetical protein
LAQRSTQLLVRADPEGEGDLSAGLPGRASLLDYPAPFCLGVGAALVEVMLQEAKMN